MSELKCLQLLKVSIDAGDIATRFENYLWACNAALAVRAALRQFGLLYHRLTTPAQYHMVIALTASFP